MKIDNSYLERWDHQFNKIKKPDPICCGQSMEWFMSNQIGYHYRCSVCGRKGRRKYYHEFYTDSDGKTQLRRKSK